MVVSYMYPQSRISSLKSHKWIVTPSAEVVGRPTEVLDAILMFYKTTAVSDALQLDGEL